jgi:hypothetical protein
MEPDHHPSPAQQAVIRKMRIFAAVSIGIMFAGFATVMGVILYKTVKTENMTTATAQTPFEWAAPEGTRIIGLATRDGKTIVALERPDGQHVIQEINTTPTMNNK